MTKEEFQKKVEEADKELSLRDIPVHARPFHAFNILAPGYVGPVIGHGIRPEDFPEYEGPNLLKHLDAWYRKRYGDRLYMPSELGRVPILIRRQIYMIRIPVAFGNPKVRVAKLVDGMTEDMMRSLSKKESEIVVSGFLDGFALIYEIEDLLSSMRGDGDLNISSESMSILTSAIEDRDTFIRCLTGRSDTNGACFHAQQHAEKMLKSFLLNEKLHSLSELSRRPFGHNISRIFGRCAEHSPEFHELNADIALLNKVTMDIRYSGIKIEPENAVETVWASLRVGGFTACKLAGHRRRYRNPASQAVSNGPKIRDGEKVISKGLNFTISKKLDPGEDSKTYDTVLQEGKYYYVPELDFSYLCEKIKSELATMFLVESYQHGELIQVRFTMHVKNSKCYLEISDPKETSRLKKLYEDTINNNP